MKLFLRFCLILFLLIVGCTPELEPNKRILVKGVVLDSEGKGISGYEVGVYVRQPRGFFSFGQSEYLLGNGETSSDGSFNITSLSDRDDDFTIAINGRESYIDYIYATDTQDYSPPNLTFDIGTITLRRRAVVIYSITRTSQPGTSIDYTFSYENPRCVEVYENGVLNPESSDCFSENITNGILNDDRPDKSNDFYTTLGSIVTFSYSINEQPIITEIFTIDQQNYTYEFQY